MTDSNNTREMALKIALKIRDDADLGRLVRELLPRMARHGGEEAWLSYDCLNDMWRLGYTGGTEYADCELDAMLQTAWGDEQARETQ
jgi:hypothetical protein